MSKSYYSQIRDYENTFNELHNTVHNSRNSSQWQMACKNFHSFTSSFQQELYGVVYTQKNYNSPEALELVICFLEADPYFFRSGYLKEIMLRNLKRTTLNEKSIERLRNVMINAVKNRGNREFRAYCRLAAFICNDELLNTFKEIQTTGNKNQKNRAIYMLNYVTNKKHAITNKI